MTYNFLLPLNKKEIKTLNFFWSGFLIYTLSYTLSTAIVGKYHVNFKIFQIFQVIGIITFLSSAIQLIQFKVENKYLKVLYLLYCLCLFTVVIRGFNSDYAFLKDMLFNGWFGVFPYFVPLILLFPQNLDSIRKAFNIIIILSVFYIIYDAIFIKDLLSNDIGSSSNQTIVEYLTKDLSLPCGFLLLTYSYHSKQTKLFTWFIITVSILFAVMRGRRALILILIGPIIFTYIFYLLKKKAKFEIIVFSLLLACLVTIYNVEIGKSSIFHYVMIRGTENTRTPVEDCFYSDMNTSNWIIGKGINGQYYCPDIEEDESGGFSLYRTVIETDYLNIILKGGIISLALLLLIAVPAVIKGLFYSKNILTKAAGIWILLWLLSLYPTSVSTFTMNYVFVWISIGICYNQKIRNIPEDRMKAYFSNYIPQSNKE